MRHPHLKTLNFTIILGIIAAVVGFAVSGTLWWLVFTLLFKAMDKL